MTYEGLRLRIGKYYRILFANVRKKRLIDEHFTIISKNCWGGMVYESYGLIKQSPTVGLFFMASDYIRFVSNLTKYLSEELIMIRPEDSRYAQYAENDLRFGQYPIGRLDDIEIMFLHYHSPEEAKEKWERRCKRVDFDHLLIKFCDQNDCKEKDVQAFCKLDYPAENKLFFSVKDWPVNKWDGYVKVRQWTKEPFVTASHEPIGSLGQFNVTKFINRLCERH